MEYKKINCSNDCGREIEDKEKDPLKMCYSCAMDWMKQQFLDKSVRKD